MQPTSLQAFESIQESLGERQLQVYRALKKLGEADNLTLSRTLHLPINSVTPRIKELRDKKLVGVSRTSKSLITNRNVIYWKVLK